MERKNTKPLRYLFTLLNIVVGWHLLYEGVVKILDPNWTAASYLVMANGWFSDWFQAIAESPILLQITDIVNMAGLTIAGLLIITGFFTRYAAVAGAVLIGLYYIANPPMQSTGVGYGVEGHYLVVNKNLIEIIILTIIAFIPKNWYYGIGNLYCLMKESKEKAGAVEVPKEMNHNTGGRKLDRRTVIKNLISLPVLGGFAFAVAKNHGWSSFEEEDLKVLADMASLQNIPCLISKNTV